MKSTREFVTSALMSGVFVVLPGYLAILLLLRAMEMAAKLMRPLTALLPDWLPAEGLLSLLAVLIVCFLVGVAVQTSIGRAVGARMEVAFFGRLPGYDLFRSLTQRLAGDSDGTTWKPALAEIEDALVPAFVIEELDDGRFTVLVPSIPTLLAGAVYILDRDRVHLLDIPFTHAIKSISRWGLGSKELVAAMRSGPRAQPPLTAPQAGSTHAAPGGEPASGRLDRSSASGVG